EVLGHGRVDTAVGLVRDERLDLLGGHAGRLQRLGTHLRDLHGGPAEDLGPVHGQVGLPDVVGTGVDLVDVGLEVLGLADRATLLAVGTPDHRADVVGVGRAHHHSAGAVAED